MSGVFVESGLIRTCFDYFVHGFEHLRESDQAHLLLHLCMESIHTCEYLSEISPCCRGYCFGLLTWSSMHLRESIYSCYIGIQRGKYTQLYWSECLSSLCFEIRSVHELISSIFDLCNIWYDIICYETDLLGWSRALDESSEYLWYFHSQIISKKYYLSNKYSTRVRVEYLGFLGK